MVGAFCIPITNKKTPRKNSGRFKILVPVEGIEPTHCYQYEILSLARLPVPPHRQVRITA